MDRDTLLAMIKDDNLGILTVKKRARPPAPDDQLVNGFMEIVDWVDTHTAEPAENVQNIIEYQLHSRLKALRASPDKSKALAMHDKHGLLSSSKVIETLEDVFDDDDLGLFDDDDQDIFTLKHVSDERASPDKVARRKPCKDFSQFEPLFAQCHADITSRDKELRRFTGEQQIAVKQFFVLKGQLVYVAEMGEATEGKNKKSNARLRCIFENGTESDLLLRSLATSLFKDETGRRVLGDREKALDEMAGLKPEDELAGYVYILRSLSDRSDIQSIDNLFKIGFSSTTIEERVANAENEPTYLMAPVKIVGGYGCYNQLNPQKLEGLLHQFFGRACLDIEVYDNDGKRHSPREWFSAPKGVIEQAAEMVVSGDIVNYRYDHQTESIQPI